MRRTTLLCAIALVATAPFAPRVDTARAQPSPSLRKAYQRADAYLHYSVGRLMELQGMMSEALVQYRRAANADPGECAIDVAVGRILFTLGRFEEARAEVEGALEECPDNPEAAHLLGAIALSEGDPETTESVMRARAALPDAPTESTLLLAQSLLAQDRVAEAEEALRSRAETDTASPRLAHMHARTLLALEREEDALDVLLRVHRVVPDDTAIVELASRLLASLGRTGEAAEMLDSFLGTPKARARHALTLTRLHAGAGNRDEALRAARRGLRKFGETAALLRALGSVQFEAGMVDESLESYERALELDPDSAQALNFLAYTLADLDIDAERAVELARRAVEVEPESGIIRDTMGWAYFRVGRLEEAEQEIRKAIELGAEDPVILEHLGDVLYALGRKAEAIRAWERALADSPDGGSAAGKIKKARAERSTGPSPSGETD
ncbi:MAG: tetratricopeptide repeat protein [Candidatus Eisenbacteria bacterium]|nr:tetratricopeptide repeat protein [Candidatus Eisenbacteria bacterium]